MRRAAIAHLALIAVALIAVALIVVALAGCEPGLNRDAGVDVGVELRDAPSMDAGMDGGIALDGGRSPDGGLDGGAAIDTPSTGDAGFGTCSVSGVPGLCIATSDCPLGSRSVPGFCPGPAAIQCCVPESVSTCDPEARPLPNAGLFEEPGEAGCPSGMIRIGDTFCIQRFEASLVDAVSGESLSPFFNPGSVRARAVSLRGAIPQGYISGTQAAAACDEAGLRLCTDTEWLAACQGSAGTTYPYGNTREVGRCNDHRDRHPAVEYFGTSASWIYSELDHPCISQLPMSLAETGSFAGCSSEAGAFDMMGNLHEWTADPAGTFRGGFYVDTVINGPGCLYRTTAHDVSHWDYSTGFRCCWTG